MIFAIAQFIAKTFGLDISKVQRVLIWLIIGIVGVGLLILVFSLRGCFKKTPKLDQKEIQRAQTAIATEDRKEMIQVLAESDAKEKAADATEIDAKAVAVNAIAESKAKWSQASNEELAAELEARK